MKISIDELSKIVGQELNEYNEHITQVTKDSIDQVMEEALIDVKASSPRSNKTRKHYQDTWKLKTLYESKESKREVVYNTQYQLTHLLELGHLIVKNKTAVGRSPAKPHIIPARERALQKIFERIKAKI